MSFHDAPRVIDVEDEENTRLTNSPLYINVPEWSNAESSPVYEEIHEGGEQPLPNDDDSDASNHSDSLRLENTRNRRPPIRFGIDEYVVHPN